MIMAFTREEEAAIQQASVLKFYSDSYRMLESDDDQVISKALLKQAEETLRDQLLLVSENIFEGMKFGLEKLQIEMFLKERLTEILCDEMKDQDNAAEMQYC